MTATETAPKEQKFNKDGSPRKAPQRGVVKSEVIEVAEVPQFASNGARTRTSDIDVTLAELVKSLTAGQTVCIRQYEKKESGNGTMYNLRVRYNGNEKNPSEHKLKGLFEFNIGPVTVDGQEMTGLYITRTSARAPK